MLCWMSSRPQPQAERGRHLPNVAVGEAAGIKCASTALGRASRTDAFPRNETGKKGPLFW